MAVVAAGELHDQLAAGEPAGQPDRGHGRLGAGGHEADLLDRRAARRSPRRARPRARSGCRTTCRGPTAACDGRAAPGGARGRAASGPSSRPGRRTRCRRRRRGRGRGARAMKRGVPPTALKARTGEFTPPGRHRAGPARRARRTGRWGGRGRRSGTGQVTAAFSPTGPSRCTSARTSGAPGVTQTTSGHDGGVPVTGGGNARLDRSPRRYRRVTRGRPARWTGAAREGEHRRCTSRRVGGREWGETSTMTAHAIRPGARRPRPWCRWRCCPGPGPPAS